MKKYFLDLSYFILIFLFSIFTLSNLGFLAQLSLNYTYVVLGLLFALIYLFKSGNFFKKISILFLIFFISFVFSNFFVDTSFDGRCYHFTLENLFKLGYNPIYDDIKTFANQNDIYYNLLFASSYPNAIEVIRANFYLIFQNMESSKIVNFLLAFCGFFYSTYFFLNKLNKIKSIILSICVFFCAVTVCQINTKMVDFSLYYLFLFQLFSMILINKNIDKKQNIFILILATILSIATKYVGLFNSVILFVIWLILKRKKIILKTGLIITFLTLILCFQPYITNTIKFKNPLYPSVGFNKLDFMTKQNPAEFKNKPYLYKFLRSMFSSSSDSRMNDPLTPKLHYKPPFTAHYDMPYITEDVWINGFGHLFSGIFIISLFLTIVQIKKKKGLFVIISILLTTLLNPICWWARFVAQLHLLPIINCYYFRKNNYIFYLLTILILFNGFWTAKENFSTMAYKTYVMNNFYNELFEKSKQNQITVYVDKTPLNEADITILFRLREYGIDYSLSSKLEDDFEKMEISTSISDSYWLKIKKKGKI